MNTWMNGRSNHARARKCFRLDSRLLTSMLVHGSGLAGRKTFRCSDDCIKQSCVRAVELKSHSCILIWLESNAFLKYRTNPLTLTEVLPNGIPSNGNIRNTVKGKYPKRRIFCYRNTVSRPLYENWTTHDSPSISNGINTTLDGNWVLPFSRMSQSKLSKK